MHPTFRVIMPAHVRYADRSRSRLAKRDRVVDKPKPAPTPEPVVEAPPVEAPKPNTESVSETAKVEVTSTQPNSENPEN